LTITPFKVMHGSTMIRTLLIGATLGFALAIAFTAAWQPAPRALAAQDHQRSSAPATPVMDGEPQQHTDRRHDRRSSQVTPDLVERVIEIARRLDPPMAAELRLLCDDQPERLERALRTSARRYVALADLQERDPDLYESKMMELETEIEIDRLARELISARKSGDESQLSMLEERLRTQVRFHIALTIKARGDSIRRLEEHVKALRDELEEYAGNFDANVRSRMAEAIEQAQREHEAAVAQSR
jgi:hypothetical protein